MSTITNTGLLSRVLIVFTPFFWSISGCLLLFRGWRLIDASLIGFILPVALGLGILKSLLILDRIVGKNQIDFLKQEPATAAATTSSYTLTVLSTLRKTWYLVPLMVILAIILRSLPRELAPITVTLYWAVGASLCFSSRLAWYRSYKIIRSYGFT